MGKIFLAGKEAQVRPALVRDVVAYRPTKHRIAILKGIKYGSLGNRLVYFNCHLGTDAGKRSQVKRQNHADHGSVWTSTDNTLGRSWTIAD